MDKIEFFKKLNIELAEKYKIAPNWISAIRNLALGFKMDRLEIMDWIDNKLKAYKEKKQIPRRYLRPLFTFLEELSDEAWDDITKKTQYDR